MSSNPPHRMSLALPLLLVLTFACLALTRAAPTAEEEATNSGTSPRRVEFALRANTTRDLSGIWSSADQDGNTNLVKFVQQGNQLVMPSNRNPAIPYQVTITLYGGYGLGKGALWANPTFFCSFTDVVLDVVDAGFMKLTTFPAPADSKGCSAFSGTWTHYTRPY